MRYDLLLKPFDCTFYIECRLAAKPETLGALVEGLASGMIRYQPDYEDQMRKLMEKLNFATSDMELGLEPDFRTQKPIRHNINWPPTENLK